MTSQARGAGANRSAAGAEPEKSTHQLGVWRDLIDALEQVDTAWQAAHASGSSASASAQLPANVVVAMVDAAERGTRALAGIADVIVQQYDSGNAYQDAASALHRASNTWPAR